MRAGGSTQGRDRTVAVVFHEGVGSGATEYVLRVVPHLQERGWRFWFWVDDPGPLADRLRDAGHDVGGRRRHVGFSRAWLMHPPGPREKLRAMPAWGASLARAVRRRRPDLVHANSLYALPDALVARAAGARVHLQLHEMLPEGRKGALARRAIRAAGLHVATVSEASARRFAGAGPLPPIVRGGTPLPPAPERHVNGGPYVVGTVGWVCERKGTDVFVDAAARVLRERDDVEFRIVGTPGDAPDRTWAEGVLDRARAAGITHVGHVEDTFAQLRDWDLLVLPSRFDPYPLTVMEAMASGLPVVASAVDGIPEQVTPETGVLVAPGDPGAVASAVDDLLSDAARRAAMGRAARARAEARFSLEQQALALERAYLSALGGSPR